MDKNQTHNVPVAPHFTAIKLQHSSGGSLLLFKSLHSFCFSASYGSCLNRHDGSSKWAVKKKPATFLVDFEEKLAMVLRKRKQNFETFAKFVNLRGKPRSNRIICICLLVLGPVNFILAVAFTWFYGFRSCKNGSASLGSHSWSYYFHNCWNFSKGSVVDQWSEWYHIYGIWNCFLVDKGPEWRRT